MKMTDLINERNIDLTLSADSELETIMSMVDLKLDQMLQKQSMRELLRSSKRPDEILEAVIKHLDLKEETADADQTMVNTH